MAFVVARTCKFLNHMSDDKAIHFVQSLANTFYFLVIQFSIAAK